MAVSEHVEEAGVHSGDATLMLPPQTLSPYYVAQVKAIAAKTARALKISGPFNMQFLAKRGDVSVIECNLRASRSLPFVSKTVGCDFVQAATQVMLGMDVRADKSLNLPALDSAPRPANFVGIKAPMFSFTRLRGADPVLGVEMASTGEVACFGESTHEAFLQSMLSTNFQLPNKNRTILLSIFNEKFRKEMLVAVSIFGKLGYKLYGTPGTAKFYQDALGLDIVSVSKPADEMDHGPGTALHVVKNGLIDLVINLSEGTNRQEEVTSGYILRRAVVDFGVSLITDVKCAIQLAECFARGMDDGCFPPRHIGEFYNIPTLGWTTDLHGLGGETG
jgi:hypothetical protein